jgi:S-adenosylhomocysteine hydrolase
VSNDSIDKLAKTFSSMEELQIYCDAQFKTIQKLTKQLNDSRKELDEFKEKYIKLKEAKPSPEAIKLAGGGELGKLGVTDEEAICVMQLNFLKQIAVVRELTLEESKKVEIYVKTLNTIRNVPKKIELETKDMSNDQLIKLIEASVDSFEKQ